MCALQKLEHNVGLEVVVRVIGVVIEGMTRLSGTGGIGGLSGCDVILVVPQRERTGTSSSSRWTDTAIAVERRQTFCQLLQFIILPST